MKKKRKNRFPKRRKPAPTTPPRAPSPAPSAPWTPSTRAPNAHVNRVLGVDVSHHQNTIDWARVRRAGYEFAYFKATEGGNFVDKQFITNWAAARKAGVVRGAYHFFRPKVAVRTQVDNFVKTVGSITSGDLPPVLDVEVPSDWAGISKKRAVAMILEWLTAVEARLGMRPVLYLSPSFARDVLEPDPRLASYVLWLAHYTSDPSPNVPAPWRAWTFWQYSETGKVPGIAGNVDMDRFNGTRAQLDSIVRRVRSLRSSRRRLWDWWLSTFVE